MKYIVGIIIMLLVLLMIYIVLFNVAPIDHRQTISNLETTFLFLEEHSIRGSNFRGNCHYLKIESDIYVKDEDLCRPLFPSENITLFTEEMHQLYISLEVLYNKYDYNVSLISAEYYKDTIMNARFYIACTWCEYSYIYSYHATGSSIKQPDPRGIDLHYTHQDWYVYAYD